METRGEGERKKIVCVDKASMVCLPALAVVIKKGIQVCKKKCLNIFVNTDLNETFPAIPTHY